MPAELDYIADGRAAFVSTRSAWHREGTILADGISYDQAIEHGGLDWEVEKVPHYVKRIREVPQARVAWPGVARPPINEEFMVQSQDAYSVVRNDREGPEAIIGTVGDVWKPLQNHDAFSILRPMVDDGAVKIETAGVLRGGKQVWMLVQFNLQRIIAQAEEALSAMEDVDERSAMQGLYDLIVETAPFALFSNDFTGSAMARIMETWVRVVCANTYTMAVANQKGISVAVSHTSNVVEDYTNGAKVLLDGIATRYVGLAETRALMKRSILPEDISLSTSPFRKLVLDAAFPILHLERKVQRREDSGHTRAALDKAHGKRAEITRLWTRGLGHEGDYSAWEAWQGAIQYFDHESELKSKGSSRVASLYDGSLSKIKNQIGRNLVSYTLGS